jgi:hypothetical protein
MIKLEINMADGNQRVSGMTIIMSSWVRTGSKISKNSITFDYSSDEIVIALHGHITARSEKLKWRHNA